MEEMLSSISALKALTEIGTILGALFIVDKAYDMFIKWFKKSPAAQHDGKQDGILNDHEERIGSLESKTVKIEAYLASDKGRIEDLEIYSRVIAHSLIALLDNAMGVSSEADLRKARKEISEYFINKDGEAK